MVRLIRNLRARLSVSSVALLILTAAVWAVPTESRAQDTGTISGFVTDESDGQPLQGANVLVYRNDSLRTGTATDLEGSYLVRGLDPGVYEIRISYIGYQRYADTVRVRPGEVQNQNIVLTPGGAEMEEVVVEAQGDAGAARVTAGHQQIQPEDLARVPTPDVSGDLATYLSSQPGIVSTGDRGGQLFIRGGEPTQNVVQLDFMRVYQPFHVLGFYSSFPSDIIQRTDVYAGGYQARYGGGLSSVIDISTRNGNKQSYTGSVSASPFLSSAQIEGPVVPGEVSFVGSARRSVLDYGASRYVDDPLPFHFSDAFGKIHARTGSASRLSLTGLWTRDEGTLGTEVAAVGEGADSELQPEPSTVRWENRGLGLRYLVLPEFLPVRATIHLSRTYLDMEQGPESEPTRRSTINHTRMGIDADFPGENTDIEAGWSADFINLNTELGGLYQNVNQQIVGLDQVALYVSPEFRFGDFRVRSGLRMQFYRVRFDPYIEPRLRAVWSSGVHQISGSAGMYQQELLGLHDRRDAANVFTAWTNIPKEQEDVQDVREGRISRAWHGIFGYQVQPSSWLEMSLEGFYKNYSNLFISEWTAFPRFTTRLQPANGRSYGAEARVTFKWPRFYAYVNYGYSNTTYWAQQSSLELWYGAEELRFTPPHDRRHQINVLASASLWGFDLSARWAFGSGRPFSRAVGFDGFVLVDDLQPVHEVPGSRRVIYERPYNARLPTYHRLDISLERRFQIGSAAVSLQGSLINAYDRRNIFYLDVFTLQRADQLPLVPSLGLKVSFN